MTDQNKTALLSKLRAPVADESPMAKIADALREKARQEQLAYLERHDADRPASAPVAGEAQEDLAPPKCPITGRPFFMALEHPELGMVPTYGGPYDSYTIPHLGGKPDQPWHERDLRVYRYDHDLGGWIADETEVIPLRIVHEDVLHGLEDAAPQASESVVVQFAGVGSAGPFPVVDKHVTLPEVTMRDLAQRLAPQASEAVAAEALEVAREALMEIADLADVDADDRSVIVNQALTKIDRITALSAQPGAQKEQSDA